MYKSRTFCQAALAANKEEVMGQGCPSFKGIALGKCLSGHGCPTPDKAL
jgi:hypothetical protein